MQTTYLSLTAVTARRMLVSLPKVACNATLLNAASISPGTASDYFSLNSSQPEQKHKQMLCKFNKSDTYTTKHRQRLCQFGLVTRLVLISCRCQRLLTPRAQRNLTRITQVLRNLLGVSCVERSKHTRKHNLNFEPEFWQELVG